MQNVILISSAEVQEKTRPTNEWNKLNDVALPIALMSSRNHGLVFHTAVTGLNLGPGPEIPEYSLVSFSKSLKQVFKI